MHHKPPRHRRTWWQCLLYQSGFHKGPFSVGSCGWVLILFVTLRPCVLGITEEGVSCVPDHAPPKASLTLHKFLHSFNYLFFKWSPEQIDWLTLAECSSDWHFSKILLTPTQRKELYFNQWTWKQKNPISYGMKASCFLFYLFMFNTVYHNCVGWELAKSFLWREYRISDLGTSPAKPRNAHNKSNTSYSTWVHQKKAMLMDRGLDREMQEGSGAASVKPMALPPRIYSLD